MDYSGAGRWSTKSEVVFLSFFFFLLLSFLSFKPKKKEKGMGEDLTRLFCLILD